MLLKVLNVVIKLKLSNPEIDENNNHVSKIYTDIYYYIKSHNLCTYRLHHCTSYVLSTIIDWFTVNGLTNQDDIIGSSQKKNSLPPHTLKNKILKNLYTLPFYSHRLFLPQEFERASFISL